MKRLILSSLCVLFLVVSNARALPVLVYSVNGPQDPLYLNGDVHEFGDNFPADELIESYYQTTTLTACTEYPYDDTQVANILVTITNLTNRTVPLWYVADNDVTSISNYDGYIGNASLNDAWYAFRIDHDGVNQPLIFESKGWNNLFEPGETWEFIIQDFISTGPPTPFGSYGIASSSPVSTLSTGSLVTPEPATIALLGLGGLLLRRRKSA